MRLARTEDIRRLDERAEKEFGIPRTVLMENAGVSVVLAMERVLGSLEGKRVAILCGKGGNGGDGMCAARHLISHGASVVVGLVGGREGLAGETLINYTILERMGVTPHDVKGEAEMGWVRAAAGAADYVVDSLLGVGSRLPIAGVMEAVVSAVNESGRPVVCVDAPSGLDVDTGAVTGACVRAVLTVTLGMPKLGLVLYPGTMYVGKLVVADLTFPLQLLTDPAVSSDIVLQEEAAELIPSRRPQAHKHEVGRVLVVAGSKGMTGAALLTGEGALAGGAGLVYLAVPASAARVLHGRRPELIIQAQEETEAGVLSERASDALLSEASSVRAMALGPGVGVDDAAKKVQLALMKGASCPLVADADALTALAAQPGVLAAAAGPRVLTPHSGEMARLLCVKSDEVESDRPGSARRAAEKFGSVVLLKGARSIVAEPGGRIFVIPTGNPGLASGGTGDVLTGLVAALLAQRMAPLSAALLGAYSHGLAADLAREEKTELSLTATDVAAWLPRAFARMASRDDRGAGISGIGKRRD